MIPATANVAIGIRERIKTKPITGRKYSPIERRESTKLRTNFFSGPRSRAGSADSSPRR
jgi:hypothetical protein